MNKNAIKKYAVAARRKLIEAVTRKMEYYGFTEKSILSDSEAAKKLADNGVYLNDSQKKARAALATRIKQHGFQIVAEEVAYTWFNRLAALRFMEVNSYLPSGIRILSSGDENRLEPECLREWERLDFIKKSEAEKEKLQGDEALYRYILVKQCNELGKFIPGMFSVITDYAELLLPDRLYTKDGIVYDLTHSEISEADFGEQVEIIGWLYQYYISEKKDEVFAALKKNVKITKENVPAATQLFTPDWIVRYMVENSLGRLWLEYCPPGMAHGNAEDALRELWLYYIEEAEQTDEVECELKKVRDSHTFKTPEEIKLIDPCMGSGHILVYAFDVLYQIYFSQGYSERDIPDLILKNNIFGLDIDERACQLTNFALMMKARSYNRRFFRRDPAEIPQPQVYSTVGDAELEEYGSLLKVDSLGEKPELPDIITLDDIDFEDRLQTWTVRSLLAQKYDVVVTNPPYMSPASFQMDWVKKNYPDSKSDLCVVFIERNFELLKQSGYLSMITMHSWMFLSSYEKFREKLISSKDIVNMAHLGARAFEEIGGEVVQTTAFVMSRSNIADYYATYARLVDFNNQHAKEKAFLAGDNNHTAKKENFGKIPGWSVAYWISINLLKCFDNKLLDTYAEPKQGFATGDNGRFLRNWHEVSLVNLSLDMFSRDEALSCKKKWFPCNKGGTYRKWYGNNDIIANWENNGFEMTNFSGSVIRNPKYYFRDGLTWSTIANDLSMRYSPTGFVFETKGSVCFIKDEKYKFYFLGLLNSKQINKILLILSPTLDFHEGPMARVPAIVNESYLKIVSDIVEQNIAISRADWDSFETSWDFKIHPLLAFHPFSPQKIKEELEAGFHMVNTLKETFNRWKLRTDDQFDMLKSNEEELNRIFIDIYGLQDELTPEVEDKDVTVRKADLGREIRSLISYAVGCMFGRYSLDVDGLAYAGGEWDANKYKTFVPSDNNILPITDMDYFTDDIVLRFVEFVRVVYGRGTLDENLDFIAETLYPNANGSSREKIRRYFLNDFYKDHVKIYQKKPIYWQFDSGKQGGFKALIYLHRYDKYTVGRVRMEYLHPLQRKYEAEVERLLEIASLPETPARDKADAGKRVEVLRKKITECREYDQIIAHIAVQNIELDLDDGVTANYAKFQGVEITQGDGRLPVKMDLLGKF